MSNEEKILFLLVKVQCDVLELKQRVEDMEAEEARKMALYG